MYMIKLSDFFDVVSRAWHLSVILMCFSFSKSEAECLFSHFCLLSCDTSLYILPVFLLGCWCFLISLREVLSIRENGTWLVICIVKSLLGLTFLSSFIIIIFSFLVHTVNFSFCSKI